MPMQWSPQQEAFLDWAINGSGSCVLVAVAGAQTEKPRITKRHVHHVRDGVVVLSDHDLLEEHAAQ